MKIEISGDSSLIKTLKSLAQHDFSDVLTKACMLVEAEAKQRCPVDSGYLRNSITTSVEDNVGYIGSNVEYAPYVEYGTGLFAEEGNGRKDTPWWYKDAKGEWHKTSGQNPQPYLRPAINNNQQRITELIAHRVEELLK